ncbi:tRNA lysidine(34) synthetase TilS [Alkaliphilus oremlandii]|uniref:tRNA(Ile)-lysidine synthase n=1 Tax=Alkaliphilus oremlandii (strain OhILAs) TaxID=350688 RepID=A8MLS6_ALKOO|nr:tRNA lysidine(34) synthetase TilS [Alkaliphilus oremlandii]ABW17993.1 tRNA(Ile)-lysidine synthetase [Alkaliphilus oremlandii OhILAs]
MIDKIKKTIHENNLIEWGDRIIVAISGGPDSVCLLHNLYQLREEYNLELYGAHLNHNFRGIDAQVDAQYVANLCEELNILCFIKSMDVPQYAKEKGLSSEEAGRILRYEFFDEIAEQVGANKIAVAHNENDQAETVLMRLLRGTGLQGLTAIHINRGRIIRPLLGVDRKSIEEYCEKYQLSPRIDKTNLESIYKRNKIRLELIPYLEEHYNPNIIENLVRTAEILKEDFDFIEEQSREIYSGLMTNQNEFSLTLPLEAIRNLHPAIKSRVIRLAAEQLLGRQEILEYKHVQNVLDLVEKGATGKKTALPLGLIAKISYENLCFTTEAEESRAYEYELPLEDFLYLEELDGTFEARVFERNQTQEISRDKYCKCFDYDQIKNTLNVRNRREGDKFYPLGLTGSKKLKDFFIDYKIDRDERERMPLVCDGNEIMWVVGLRISEKYKITDKTTRILEVTFNRGDSE